MTFFNFSSRSSPTTGTLSTTTIESKLSVFFGASCKMSPINSKKELLNSNLNKRRSEGIEAFPEGIHGVYNFMKLLPARGNWTNGYGNTTIFAKILGVLKGPLFPIHCM